MQQRIGFIGLGIMGKPMARNLLKAGYPVTVYTRKRETVEAFRAEGAREHPRHEKSLNVLRSSSRW